MSSQPSNQHYQYMISSPNNSQTVLHILCNLLQKHSHRTSTATKFLCNSLNPYLVFIIPSCALLSLLSLASLSNFAQASWTSFLTQSLSCSSLVSYNVLPIQPFGTSTRYTKPPGKSGQSIYYHDTDIIIPYMDQMPFYPSKSWVFQTRFPFKIGQHS